MGWLEKLWAPAFVPEFVENLRIVRYSHKMDLEPHWVGSAKWGSEERGWTKGSTLIWYREGENGKKTRAHDPDAWTTIVKNPKGDITLEVYGTSLDVYYKGEKLGRITEAGEKTFNF